MAQELRSAPRIYFPHNLDFRGRAYPMHPYLNHMGDDVSRGLLTFAEAKPLGKTGFMWLKVHVSIRGPGAPVYRAATDLKRQGDNVSCQLFAEQGWPREAQGAPKCTGVQGSVLGAPAVLPEVLG